MTAQDAYSLPAGERPVYGRVGTGADMRRCAGDLAKAHLLPGAVGGGRAVQEKLSCPWTMASQRLMGLQGDPEAVQPEAAQGAKGQGGPT